MRRNSDSKPVSELIRLHEREVQREAEAAAEPTIIRHTKPPAGRGSPHTSSAIAAGRGRGAGRGTPSASPTRGGSAPRRGSVSMTTGRGGARPAPAPKLAVHPAAPHPEGASKPVDVPVKKTATIVRKENTEVHETSVSPKETVKSSPTTTKSVSPKTSPPQLSSSLPPNSLPSIAVQPPRNLSGSLYPKQNSQAMEEQLLREPRQQINLEQTEKPNLEQTEKPAPTSTDAQLDSILGIEGGSFDKDLFSGNRDIPAGMSQEQLMSTAQALMSELENDIYAPLNFDQPSQSQQQQQQQETFAIPQQPQSIPRLTVSPSPPSVSQSAPAPVQQTNTNELSPVGRMSELDREISNLRRSNESATDALQLTSGLEELGSRNNCAFCKHRVLIGPYYDIGGGKRVHVDCFRCEKCKEPLVQFQCIDGRYYCPSCSHEIRPPSICRACGKTISTEDVVVALDAEWHRSCFQCAHCHKVLDKDYVTYDGKPYCLPQDSPCYRIAQGKVCCVCSGVLDASYLTVFEKFYHRTCFCCSGCGVPFPSLEFFQINKQSYCETCATQIIGDQLDSDSVSAT